MHKIHATILILLALPFYSFTQETFELKDSVIFLCKSLDFENVHWYGEIINLQDSVAVDLIWKMETPFGTPVAWECNFDDQTQNSVNVMDGDSAQFVLKSDQEILQKLIIGVQHNGSVGMAQYLFKISSLDEPEKVKTQLFRIKFTESTTSTEGLPEEHIPLQYLNGHLMIQDNIQDLQIFNSSGLSILHVSNANRGNQFSLQNSGSGIHFVHWMYKGKGQVRKFYF